MKEREMEMERLMKEIEEYASNADRASGTLFPRLQVVKRIKVIFSDVDGVLTNNQVLEGAPFKGKWRSHSDGQGVSLLRDIGIRVAFITNESDDSAKLIKDTVEKWNNLPSSSKIPNDDGWAHVGIFTGVGGKRKVEAAEIFLEKFNLTFDDAAAMGDDLADIPLLRAVNFSATPASGEYVVRKMVDFISRRRGGEGALRDFVNFILLVRGIDPTTRRFQ